MSTAVQRVRERAALLIEERGWAQGGWKGPNGELCLDAALWVACGEPAPEELRTRWPALAVSADTAIQGELGLPPSGRWRSLAHWNDEAGRTREQVLAALRGESLVEEPA